MPHLRHLIIAGVTLAALLLAACAAPPAAQESPMATPTPAPAPAPAPAPQAIHVNQLGYLPDAVKRAVIVDDSPAPLPWLLRDAQGASVASGETTVFGADPASGDQVHLADFSSFQAPGAGYTLVVGQATSPAFAIGAGLYRPLTYDALAYFYHNRSGIAIEMPYASDPQWARPAGHLGAAPNQGDTEVPCAPGTGCSYRLDVRGGWYDAGDHGKYVVNGGISVWTLQNLYERALTFGDPAAFADGSMNIPERANGFPDLLDEARWQVEFLLRMQVPEGEPLAGLAHHKVHDDAWTGLPLRPDQDPRPRYLRPPSTAATLNLAAVAAQAARLWRELDPAFAERCLAAATRAWQAAQANPAIFAPASDSTGGGPYNDDNVADEFAWAAAELLITTGDAGYRAFLGQSPAYGRVPSQPGGSAMSWADTAALGTISLAIAPSALEEAERQRMREAIVAAADSYLAMQGREGYRIPFAAGSGGYPWGSNSSILNTMIILALAHDFTGGTAYRDGVVEGMAYLLGRNPLGQSYITGYGSRPLQNPHHRFWARQISAGSPPPPPGAVSGGPNSALQDPYANNVVPAGCPPQRCFVDHIESWSTNEITINWNAPLAWVAAYLDEQGS